MGTGTLNDEEFRVFSAGNPGGTVMDGKRQYLITLCQANSIPYNEYSSYSDLLRAIAYYLFDPSLTCVNEIEIAVFDQFDPDPIVADVKTYNDVLLHYFKDA